MVNGNSCLKLVGVQQTEDWDRPRGDRGAWQRRTPSGSPPGSASPSASSASSCSAEPARREPSQRSQLRYDLESSLQYPGQLSEDSRQEVLQAWAFRDSAAPLLPNPGAHGQRLTALLKKINNHLQNQPPTPTARPSSRSSAGSRRRPRARRRRRRPTRSPRPGRGRPRRTGPRLRGDRLHQPGQRHLRQWLGRPVLLVFYLPSSPTATEVLRFAQEVSDAHGKHVAVLGLSVSDDAGQVLRQRRPRPDLPRAARRRPPRQLRRREPPPSSW